ncbi:MAG: NYN domain-containing protein [Verrucomicrobia bacterium]|nr:NYN domain-containing protein [Verrucomicrobiota bacterium]
MYFYDAPPANGLLKNPIDGSTLNLATTPHFRQYTSLIDALEMKPNFAVRRGEVVVHGWKLGSQAFDAMLKAPRAPTGQDIVPNIEQKGVDLRIGLDIARLALREMVEIIVVVTGDSDLVPAFRFARREGVRVYLDHLGHGVRRDLKAHADIVL